MSNKFTGLKARNYEFRNDDNTRDVIQIMAGNKHVAFIEYDTARTFVDRIHDLADAHETQQQEGAL